MSRKEWDFAVYIRGFCVRIEGLLNNDVHVCALHMEMEMAGEGGMFGTGGLM